MFCKARRFEPPRVSAKLLRFVVERSLEGETESLKEYTLGSQVLERGADFDPQTDPIVRVQAGRLRSKLEGYYHTEGKDNPVRIALPKGGYVPDFSGTTLADDSVAKDQSSRHGPRPAVLPLVGLLAAASAVAIWFLIAHAPIESAPGVIRVALSPPADSTVSAAAISPNS